MGVTKDYERRISEHKRSIKNHQVKQYNLYEGNIDDYIFSIIEKDVEYNRALDLEVFYIKYFNSLHPNGYNNALGSSHPHTEEYKHYMSELQSGRKLSKHTKELISEKRLAKHIHPTEETKNKISLASQKRWTDEEYRKRISSSHKKFYANPANRKARSDMTKERMKNLTPEERKEKYGSNRIPVQVVKISDGSIINFHSKTEFREFFHITCGGTKINQMIQDKVTINNEYKIKG